MRLSPGGKGIAWRSEPSAWRRARVMPVAFPECAVIGPTVISKDMAIALNDVQKLFPGTLSGSTASTANGVTTFSGWTIDTANNGDVLTATDAADSLTTTSSAFDVTVGAPAQLVFSIQPGNATGGQHIRHTARRDHRRRRGQHGQHRRFHHVGHGFWSHLSGCSSTTTAGVAVQRVFH